MSNLAASNRKLFAAWTSWRRKKLVGDPNNTDLFSFCEQNNLIDKLVQLPLDPAEQDQLIDYLINVSNVKGSKLEGILCLLLHGKLDQAQQYKHLCVSSTSDGDDDLFQNGTIVSAILDSYTKNLPHCSSSKRSTSHQESVTPPNEKYNAQQDTQTPFTDSSLMNESVRRRRARKPKDQTPIPTHTMMTRASARKKSLGQ